MDLSSWMASLPDSVAESVPLVRLPIPGSHDSATSSLNISSPIALDQPQWLQHLACPAVKRVVLNWSRTQQLSCLQQLQSGIRYLDFRVAHRDDIDDFVVTHGLYGDRLLDILTQLRDEFLHLHPREVLFLDFNHFYGFSGAAHLRLMDLIRQCFGPLLVSAEAVSSRLASLTLSQLWDSDHRVFVFYQVSAGLPIRGEFWSSSSIASPWAQTDRLNDLMKFLDGSGRQRPFDRFFVSQGVLTPSSADIIRRPFDSLLNCLAADSTRAVVEWISERPERLPFLNIVMVDFVQLYGFISVVVQLATTAMARVEDIVRIAQECCESPSPSRDADAIVILPSGKDDLTDLRCLLIATFMQRAYRLGSSGWIRIPKSLALWPEWISSTCPSNTCGSRELSVSLAESVEKTQRLWPCPHCPPHLKCVDLHGAFQSVAIQVPSDQRHIPLWDVGNGSWSDEGLLLATLSESHSTDSSSSAVRSIVTPENRRTTVRRTLLLGLLGKWLSVDENAGWREITVGSVHTDSESGGQSSSMDVSTFLRKRMALLEQLVEAKCAGQEGATNQEICKSLLHMSVAFELLSPSLINSIHVNPSVLDKRGVRVMYNYARLCSILRTFHQSLQAASSRLVPLNQLGLEVWESIDRGELRVVINHLADLNRLKFQRNQAGAVQRICQSWLALSTSFSRFHGKVHVLNFEAEHNFPKLSAHIHVLTAMRVTYETLFDLLGVKPVESM